MQIRVVTWALDDVESNNKESAIVFARQLSWRSDYKAGEENQGQVNLRHSIERFLLKKKNSRGVEKFKVSPYKGRHILND